jgi:hypothetical protein
MSDAPQRVVLVCNRHAEDSDDRVADELLDGAAVRLDRRAHLVVVREHQLPDGLGVDSLRKRRVVRHVAEEQRRHLPPLVAYDRERDAAGVAEAGVVGIVSATGRTALHQPSLERTGAAGCPA